MDTEAGTVGILVHFETPTIPASLLSFTYGRAEAVATQPSHMKHHVPITPAVLFTSIPDLIDNLQHTHITPIR